ncbi:MAG: hypothetical protein D6715_06220, partial [Calditrichaeota bacterium]
MATTQPERQILVVGNDPVLLPRLQQLAAAHRMALQMVPGPEHLKGTENPAILVVPVSRQLLDFYARWKDAHPDCLLAAWADAPEHELWVGASAAGCDLVVNKGALDLVLAEQLQAWQAQGVLVQPRRRLPVKRLANPGEGLVGRVPDAPDGPIAVFRLEGRLCAFRDVCPHAGFSLSDGAFDADSGILTCPAHGSQFQVCTGARMRGPADFPI